ncbi:hypothetical protein PAHAL_3G309200 [Panicum hallii]|uniref:Ribulose bisphosphate carboxylase small subunit n=1 Tax=Panicum hallii TaxID=206008 RepID=A0A2T8KK42_9POAL|nr:hypothetical protein PAHAL_3G309200 [Panicum hallii]
MTSSATSVAPFQGLKSTAGLPVSRRSSSSGFGDVSNGGRIRCMQFSKVGFIYRENARSPGYYDGRYWTMWKLPMFGCTDSTQVYAELEEAKRLDANLPEKRAGARFLVRFDEVGGYPSLCPRKAYSDAYIRILGFDNVRQAGWLPNFEGFA